MRIFTLSAASGVQSISLAPVALLLPRRRVWRSSRGISAKERQSLIQFIRSTPSFIFNYPTSRQVLCCLVKLYLQLNFESFVRVCWSDAATFISCLESLISEHSEYLQIIANSQSTLITYLGLSCGHLVNRIEMSIEIFAYLRLGRVRLSL